VQLVCGHMAAVRAVQPRVTGMRACSRSLVAVERRDAGSEDGSARLTWQAVGKSPTCRGTCVRDMDLSLVSVAHVCMDS